MSEQTDATVHIPTLDGGERLARCLESLAAQTVVPRVMVADNGSGDGCAELLRDRFPWVERIAFGRNLGFGPALNRAVEASARGHVILLNDDAVATPTFVERLLESAGKAEMIAAVLLRDGDPGRIDSAGVTADLTLMAFDYLAGREVGALEGAPAPLGPTGGAALYRRRAFEAVGGFDERIFLYYEDLDLALRMRAASFGCALAAGARVTHGHSETLGDRSPRKYAMTGWSRGFLLRRYGVMRRPAPAAGALAREAAICAGQLLRDRTGAGIRGRIGGWRAGRGAFGPPALPPGLEELTLREALSRRRATHGG